MKRTRIIIKKLLATRRFLARAFDRKTKDFQKESGNVLFLILIAVALFAALSYAVTQSTRSGSGATTNETAGLDAAELVQYPTGVRTAVLRMVIDGVDPQNLEFNAPSTFGDLTSTEVGVFHPDGGGATYVLPPDATWVFNANFEILNIGTSVSSDFAGNEYIALLVGIPDSVCGPDQFRLGHW